ncbi:MAG: hypothetical protein MRECE_39c019 [Mycoplasmataceae bacterium CE_OT135]|nr:MAG: hypothetical protein MRECE_39c019 [Mycoplasmataceae bacterium CE_OT135]
MAKPKDSHFKDEDTENFHNGKKVLELQILSKSDKQNAHRKVVLVRRAKSWKEIIMYFPPGASGGRLEKLSKNQYSIRLSKQYRLLFCWDKEKQFAYDIHINPHDKKYGKK